MIGSTNPKRSICSSFLPFILIQDVFQLGKNSVWRHFEKGLPRIADSRCRIVRNLQAVLDHKLDRRSIRVGSREKSCLDQGRRASPAFRSSRPQPVISMISALSGPSAKSERRHQCVGNEIRRITSSLIPDHSTLGLYPRPYHLGMSSPSVCDLYGNISRRTKLGEITPSTIQGAFTMIFPTP